MAVKVVIISVLFAVTSAAPAVLLDSNDSDLIGSEVREVIKPFEDLHTAGTSNHGEEFGADGDDKGYYTSKSKNGNKGYKHYDSYHKKDGDKYGYERHSAYGKDKDDGEHGGSYYTSSSYQDGDKEGRSNQHKALKRKDTKPESTEFYENYESEADDGSDHGDFHYEGEGESESDHAGYSNDYSEADGDSEGYTNYNEGNDHNGYYSGPSAATSYYVRHY